MCSIASPRAAAGVSGVGLDPDQRRPSGSGFACSARAAAVPAERFPWPISVAPAPDESLASWLQRQADALRVSVADLLDLPGFRRSAHGGPPAGLSPAHLQRLADGSGATLLDLQRRWPTDHRTGLVPLLPRRAFRCCPACLRHPPAYVRVAWCQPHTVVCAEHRALLLDACPGCGEDLTVWPATQTGRRVLALHRCGHCAFDLRDAASLPGSDAAVQWGWAMAPRPPSGLVASPSRSIGPVAAWVLWQELLGPSLGAPPAVLNAMMNPPAAERFQPLRRFQRAWVWSAADLARRARVLTTLCQDWPCNLHRFMHRYAALTWNSLGPNLDLWSTDVLRAFRRGADPWPLLHDAAVAASATRAVQPRCRVAECLLPAEQFGGHVLRCQLPVVPASARA